MSTKSTESIQNESITLPVSQIRDAQPGALLINLDEAGRRLDCSRRTIERERDRGNLRCVRLGGRWKITLAELQRYVRSLETTR